MRQLVIVFLLLLINNKLPGQSKEDEKKIDSLTSLITETVVKQNEIMLQRIDLMRQVMEIRQKYDSTANNDPGPLSSSTTINNYGGKLREEPGTRGKIIKYLDPDDTVLVFNWFQNPYFKVASDKTVGYIHKVTLNENEMIAGILEKEEKLWEESQNSRFVQLIEIYGPELAKRIGNEEYWIGMTSEITIVSIGHPDIVNRSSGSWGVREEWIYSQKDLHLYFEDGLLTAIKDK